MDEELISDEELMPQKIGKNKYEILRKRDMLVPGIIYGNEEIILNLIEDVKSGKEWNALKQVYNVATLPGIQKASIAMPDIHPGYGFCIGGIGAFDLEKGVISVAGVGFDINCGVRTLILPYKAEYLTQKNKEKLAEELYKQIPAGLGSKGKLELSESEIDEVLRKGARYIIKKGYGLKEDLEYIEENGCVDNADPKNVSKLAKQRQFKQIGTLGSGNHYLEVQKVTEIYDKEIARAFELEEGQLLISIHCGSRALGHQIGMDYLKELEIASKKYKIPIREKELVCAPFKSKEGQKYFSAVNAGINCAFANRQVLTHLVRQVFKNLFKTDERKIRVLYDVGHNTCKIEKHEINGSMKKLLVHRKGATRGFGPGREEIPVKYREFGQPVIIGGSMGTESYILAGTEKGMKETFGSVCHGAGRIKSRFQAKKELDSKTIINQLESKGIIIKGHSRQGLVEEAPQVYKNVSEVINVLTDINLAKKVVQLKPIISIKG